MKFVIRRASGEDIPQYDMEEVSLKPGELGTPYLFPQQRVIELKTLEELLNLIKFLNEDVIIGESRFKGYDGEIEIFDTYI